VLVPSLTELDRISGVEIHASQHLGSEPKKSMRTVYTLYIGLLWAASCAAIAADAPDFLLPSQAFKLDATSDASGVHLRWRVAKGHYVYRNRLAVTSSTPGVVLAQMVAPRGDLKDDPQFGSVEVYRDELPLHVAVNSGSGQAVIAATVQGCADAGLCYPPYTQEVTLELTPSTVTKPSNALYSESVVAQAASTETDSVQPATSSEAGAAKEPQRKARMDALAAALGMGGSSAKSGTTAEQSNAPTTDGGGALSALQSLGQSFGMGSEAQFLEPDQAFVLDTRVNKNGAVEALWAIEDGYYLYRNKFKFTVTGGDGGALGPMAMAPGKPKSDEYFGDTEVYYYQALARVPVHRSSGDGNRLNLRITYQGCADAGLCYPPISKNVSLMLPASFTPSTALATTGSSSGTAAASSSPTKAPSSSGGTAAAGPVLEDMVSEQDQLTEVLKQGDLWIIVAVFFGGGLLLALTPCVLPMIPILSGIIVGQGETVSRSKGFALSFVYVQGMAIAYTVLGLVAGLSGANVQVMFQDPYVLVTFAAVFVALAMSMFGFYELQVPSAIQSRLANFSNNQRSGSYLGVGVMGVLSAIIVGPCVAPPLIGVLSYISLTGDPLLGGLALYAMAMGMGVPLLIVGASAGQLLPRAGAWMDAVKAVFGVMLLAVAVFFLERVVPGWLSMLAWASLLIITAIYMGALDQLQAGVSGWRRLWKGMGLVMMVYGVLLMVGAAGGGTNPLLPLRGLSAGSGPATHDAELTFRRVKGLDGLQAALREAGAQGKPVMLDYYADWCISCKEMEQFTFTDPSVHAALAGVVLLQVDVTANDDADQALLKNFGLLGPPTIQFFLPDGAERRNYRVVGYMGAVEFRKHVERALGRGAAGERST
jgi:thioredoxin:protein disulfide reductase